MRAHRQGAEFGKDDFWVLLHNKNRNTTKKKRSVVLFHLTKRPMLFLFCNMWFWEKKLISKKKHSWIRMCLGTCLMDALSFLFSCILEIYTIANVEARKALMLVLPMVLQKIDL